MAQMTVDRINKPIAITPIFTRTLESLSRVIINVGGAGSSKTFSIAQVLVHKFITESGKSFAIGRATMPSLKMTAMLDIINLLKLYGVYEFCDHNKTDHVIKYNGNLIQFFSTGGREANIDRIKSTNFNYIWLEEANEFTWTDYLVIEMRLRAPSFDGMPNHIYLSLNPTNATGWIPTKLAIRKGVDVIHSTYKDNPFLSIEYRDSLINLINENENYYRIYTLGEWGILENLVFTKIELNCRVPDSYDMMAYGLDFGFHPSMTALVKVIIKDMKTYYQERIYQNGLTNSDLIEKLSHEERGDISADSAEPARIEEIYRAGYNIYPTEKGKDSVKLGLDLMRREPIRVTEDSPNMAKEVQNYQHKKDKDGNILEDPVPFNDHAIDAARYGKKFLTERYGYATAAPQEKGEIVTQY